MAGLIITFSLLQFNLGTAIMGALVPVLGYAIQHLRAKSERIPFIRERIEGLYAPFSKVAETMLDPLTVDNYITTFTKHMDREIGGLHKHLALPRTLAAYYSNRQGDLDHAWATNLARAFEADHLKLAQEYQRLTTRYL